MKINSTLKLGGLLVLAGLAGFVLLGRPPVAAVAAVKRGRAVNAVPATVIVRAGAVRVVRSEIGGSVKSAALAVGARVRAGDVLVQIDDVDLQIGLKQLNNAREAVLKRQKVGSASELLLTTAREDWDRAKRQAEAGTFPPADLEKLQRNVQQLENTVALEKIDREAELADLASKLEVQQRLIGKTRLIAQEDGQVVTAEVRPGDLIPADASLATLVSDTPVVEASISEESYAGIAPGQRATVTLLGYGTEKFEATVAAVLPTTDPATQRYTVRLDVKIAPGRLIPGLGGEARVILGERANALLAPRRALQGDYVLVAKDGRVEQRHVVRGFANLQEIELVSGVAEGELVITDSLDAFRPGDRVRAEQP